MEEQIEQWELGSGTWQRQRATEAWRLLATAAGAPVSDRIPPEDLARLLGARRDPASRDWFPPDFKFSPRTGAMLNPPRDVVEGSWVPPFGASTPSGSQHASQGLKRTSAALWLAPRPDRAAGTPPDRTLPSLPPGQYRFVVDRFDATCPSLLALEQDAGRLHVLLPDAKQWSELEGSAVQGWGHRLPNPRGWRMELRRAEGHATMYCPSATGLVALTPAVLGLRCGIEPAGHGPALGGPVAWDGEIWTPTLASDGTVQLIGKAPAAGRADTVLSTPAPVPHLGFEAPVFADAHVTWPCDAGQLVLRRDTDAAGQAEWVPWPEDVKPLFAVGCPWLREDGTFWQLCRRTSDGGIVHVQVAGAGASTLVEAAGPATVSTGRVCYRGTKRFEGVPWSAHEGEVSMEAVLPLLESARDGTVLGLRMDAPRGVPALVQGHHEPKRAILQVERAGAPAVAFGGIAVKRPWLALPFVYDGHLWIHHPELRHVPGWKLESAPHD